MSQHLHKDKKGELPGLDSLAALPQYQGLLLRVLGKLARQGMPVAPDEGLDLIQDFFLECWDGLAERFDPSRGKFEGYLAVSFFRFARRRIAKQSAWRARLVDAHAMAEIVDTGPLPPALAERNESLTQVEQAIHSLPEKLKKVLVEFLSSKATERRLALQFGLTRYALREMLVEALGRVSVEFADRLQLSDQDQAIARCLWSEGRSVRATADYLEVPISEIQSARLRNAQLLLGAIRRINSSPATRKGAHR